ncbi:MAG: hypothetical protein EB149_07855 [Thaumarchaeota archaeon]|nr:hypothetical protein [Nitrososphaerota archaeon]
MKKDDFSLIRSGLASELYLLFFLKTDSTYEHAKIIKKTKQVPDVSKVYLARDRLEDQGFIEKKGLRYYPVIEKLAEGIVELLKQKNKRLTRLEFDLLCFLIRNMKFVQIFSPQFIKQITKQPNGTHHIDALELIGNVIGNTAMGAYLMQKLPSKYSKFIPKHQNVSFADLKKEGIEIEVEWNEVMKVIDVELKGNLQKEGIVLPDYIFERIISLVKSLPIYVIMFDRRFTKKLAALATADESMSFIEQIQKSKRSKSISK